MDEKIEAVLQTLSEWYDQHQRQLPFRGVNDPYQVWVSEVLLQQTQISRGISYYERFVERFPTVQALAAASWEEFFPYFEGLGYYDRGRNMLKAAQIITEQYDGRFPETKEELERLPGVGSYTADAILSFAFHQPTLPLDTNIKRILGRVFLGTTTLDEKSEEARALLRGVIERYQTISSAKINQAMMDFASAVCFATKPFCMFCPLQPHCRYFKKELPYTVPKKKIAPREAYTAKYPLAVIRYQKKVLLCGESLLGGVMERGNERDFLKDLAKQQLGVELSVRAAYKTWIDRGIQYSLHRCYILLGEEQLQARQPRMIDAQEVENYIAPLP
ncbi:MAG: A/G-specific adenine glycosylase [Acidobacteriaceae bacterium]|nr:A/G-specific adenine glycosylase [Acidobacteriaceae bacterium]